MATELTVSAVEESTYVVVAAFTDEEGAAVTPSSVAWTLTDATGNVINSRNSVSATPGTSINIVLSGDDLAIGTNGTSRRVTVQATYNSGLGTGLPLKAECYFSIENLLNVS